MKWQAIVIAGLFIALLLNRKRAMNDLSKIRLSKNFVLSEFVRTSTGFDNIPNETEIENIRSLAKNVLQPLRDYLARPVVISSGFRSQQVNEAVGGSETSQHRTGEAADISVEGVTNKQIIDAIIFLALPFDQLIDEKTMSGGRLASWVHVSFSANRQRAQVLAARWDGTKTIYTNYA